MTPAPELRLDDAAFAVLRDVVRAASGLAFGPDARATLERRLRGRVEATGLGGFGAYVERVAREAPGGELVEVLDRVANRETYFFRQEEQLAVLAKSVLPALLAERAPSRPPGRASRPDEAGLRPPRLTLWSAGCATGEEAYGLAIAVLEAGLFTPRDFLVLGTDLSRTAVAAARRGVYGTSAFRATPPELRRRYFVDVEGGASVAEAVRQQCQFGQHNLIDPDRGLMVGRVDVVFCRNVLLYFDMEARRAALRVLHERLHPGGYLFLGHAESLLASPEPFEPVRLDGELVYRRPRGAGR